MPLAAITLAAALACADGPRAEAPDSGTAPVPLPAIPGGGTTGGSILGRLVVYVLSAGTAIPNVPVAIDTADGRITSTTDGDGRLEINRAGLRGPATITAFVPGGPYYSLAGVDAAGVSLDIDPSTSPGAIEAFAAGTVSGWDRMLPPGSAAVRVAEVRPIVRSLLAPSFDWPQRRRMDLDAPVNVVADLEGLRTYQLRADAANTTGLFARAGRSTDPGQAPPAFEYLALSGDGALSGGATTSVDLEFTIPIARPIQVSIDRRPDLPFVALIPVWRLRADALLTFADAITVEPTDALISLLAPNPTDVPGSELLMVGVATDGLGQQTLRWFRFDGPQASMPELLPLPTPTTVAPRTIDVPGRTADILQAILFAEDQPAWRVDVVGPARQSPLTWPEVPDGITDPVPGERLVSVTTLDFGDFDPDRVSFNQLSLVLEAVAFGAATIAL